MNNKGRYLKKPNQSNHENTIIPESVSQYSKQPLYIIIALWCQQQNRWINRNDIAHAFSMPVRRASFQLSYMTRRPKHIHFRSRQQISSGEGKQHLYNEIWVENVIIESQDQSIERAPPKGERGVMGAYRSRVGNGMSGGANIWDTLITMRRAKKEGDDEL
ncbi:CaiF/GrlA family transcriptional regulator [Salmonella enterica]|uniref:CaiF/GrlA family transcriptional regulator n=6 Tax=Salmonella TaxID=590 RepID=A0A707YPR1_SALTM|nr:CaiF/GrlA family transcriptional regulator [Salmonella enterica]AZT73502.1 CaiF/GrlA family transcriptional regulator [Salmonella enterica subsp. enterica serovar Waycross]EAA1506489.1 CaiF/GrlA family transcriptional regulator [Salmonella enterica subsp. enterica serovar Agama]EAA2650948.1 CaiF/GrlA family transcriptional regulator [Salmonella enterica subsp. enterica serovar Colorado]EAA7092123.1 CaiF/GrlA family transcriptional regulator [Salmonella enterica subsp. enterica serovar Koketi